MPHIYHKDESKKHRQTRYDSCEYRCFLLLNFYSITMQKTSVLGCVVGCSTLSISSSSLPSERTSSVTGLLCRNSSCMKESVQKGGPNNRRTRIERMRNRRNNWNTQMITKFFRLIRLYRSIRWIRKV